MSEEIRIQGWKRLSIDAVTGVFDEAWRGCESPAYSLSEVMFSPSDNNGMEVELPDFVHHKFEVSDLALRNLLSEAYISNSLWSRLSDHMKPALLNNAFRNADTTRNFCVSHDNHLLRAVTTQREFVPNYLDLLDEIHSPVIFFEDYTIRSLLCSSGVQFFVSLGSFSLVPEETALYGLLVSASETRGEMSAYPAVMTKFREIFVFRADEASRSLSAADKPEQGQEVALLRSVLKESADLKANRVYEVYGRSLQTTQYLSYSFTLGVESVLGTNRARKMRVEESRVKTLRDAARSYFGGRATDVLSTARAFSEGAKNVLDSDRKIR